MLEPEKPELNTFCSYLTIISFLCFCFRSKIKGIVSQNLLKKVFEMDFQKPNGLRRSKYTKCHLVFTITFLKIGKKKVI